LIGLSEVIAAKRLFAAFYIDQGKPRLPDAHGQRQEPAPAKAGSTAGT
jgi:hypothetical protein